VNFGINGGSACPKADDLALANALGTTRSTKYSRELGINGGAPCGQGDDLAHANALGTTRSTKYSRELGIKGGSRLEFRVHDDAKKSRMMEHVTRL
jgi:hypothetical protein